MSIGTESISKCHWPDPLFNQDFNSMICLLAFKIMCVCQETIAIYIICSSQHVWKIKKNLEKKINDPQCQKRLCLLGAVPPGRSTVGPVRGCGGASRQGSARGPR